MLAGRPTPGRTPGDTGLSAATPPAARSRQQFAPRGVPQPTPAPPSGRSTHLWVLAVVRLYELVLREGDGGRPLAWLASRQRRRPAGVGSAQAPAREGRLVRLLHKEAAWHCADCTECCHQTGWAYPHGCTPASYSVKSNTGAGAAAGGGGAPLDGCHPERPLHHACPHQRLGIR